VTGCDAALGFARAVRGVALRARDAEGKRFGIALQIAQHAHDFRIPRRARKRQRDAFAAIGVERAFGGRSDIVGVQADIAVVAVRRR